LGSRRYGIVVVSGSVVVVVASVVVVVASVVVVVASVVVVVATVVVVVVGAVVAVPDPTVVVVPTGGWLVPVGPGGSVVGGLPGPGEVVVTVVAGYPGNVVPLRGGRPDCTAGVVVVGAAMLSMVVTVQAVVVTMVGLVVPGMARIASSSLGWQVRIGSLSGWAISPTAAVST
jgi:hypothetical protein